MRPHVLFSAVNSPVSAASLRERTYTIAVGKFHRLDPCRQRKIALTASNFRESLAKVGLGSRERKKESWAILKESLMWAYPATHSLAPPELPLGLKQVHGTRTRDATHVTENRGHRDRGFVPSRYRSLSGSGPLGCFRGSYACVTPRVPTRQGQRGENPLVPSRASLSRLRRTVTSLVFRLSLSYGLCHSAIDGRSLPPSRQSQCSSRAPPRGAVGSRPGN